MELSKKSTSKTRQNNNLLFTASNNKKKQLSQSNAGNSKKEKKFDELQSLDKNTKPKKIGFFDKLLNRKKNPKKFMQVDPEHNLNFVNNEEVKTLDLKRGLNKHGNESKKNQQELQIDAAQWKDWLEQNKMNFRQDKELFRNIQQKVFAGLHLMTQNGRRDAWLVILNIDPNSSQIQEMIKDYHRYIEVQPQGEDELFQNERDIRKDICRTFTDLEMLAQTQLQYQEKLFNILKAYSLYNQQVGYMQGLNFVAGMILIIMQDEPISYVVLIKLLEKNQWDRLYIDQTPKLFELVYKIRLYIHQDLPKLYKYFESVGLALDPLLASPFFTLFSNLLDISSSLLLLERYMLLDEDYLVDILKNLFKQFKNEMMKMDCWDLQVFIGKQMYQRAVDQNTFFLNYHDRYYKQQ
ncbi:tbc domain containing protein [Stylonychia lemnae]|uniref:Tbc domain containing protein n=1 Tax=Stylonychia lemnae TaxID=5949 RepID=A0A078AIW1_STYLE|nr:tbc domain containing protein [Stylonychia lemnae]|eukprot:CDW82250.1 tbc domain containing protein [Stylonychia lemnae]